jgi:predicted amidophosphoribosyltransferase
MDKLQKIDELYLGNHQYLTEDDECFYFLNYVPIWVKKNSVNSLIMNFKKTMDKKDKAEWKYKGSAIEKIAKMFIESLPEIKKPNILFVPIPPSKMKKDPMYDDRMIQVLNKFCAEKKNAEMREIISIKKNMTPTHVSKLSPEEILEYLEVDEELCEDQKEKIIIVDDVITDGAHFKACQTLLQPLFPNSSISGLFIAQTIH